MNICPMFHIYCLIWAEFGVWYVLCENVCGVFPYIVLHVTILYVARYVEGTCSLPHLRRKMLVISPTLNVDFCRQHRTLQFITVIHHWKLSKYFFSLFLTSFVYKTCLNAVISCSDHLRFHLRFLTFWACALLIISAYRMAGAGHGTGCSRGGRGRGPHTDSDLGGRAAGAWSWPLQCSANVKNMWSCTFSQYGYLAWWLVKYRAT